MKLEWFSGICKQNCNTFETIVCYCAGNKKTFWLSFKRKLPLAFRNFTMLQNRGGVLEDVIGLEDRFCSPWPWPRRSSPWPRGLKSLKIGLSSARGQHYFFELLKFCGAPEKFFGKRFLWRSLEKFL